MVHAWREYTETELKQLHTVLYDLIAEFDRVCRLLHIPYVAIGGTAIGALYDKAILPWDDDVDLGVLRRDYETFIREAPALLGPDYFLSTPQSNPNNPFHFVKLRRNGTAFVEELTKDIQMHQGIYIDIFPFDKVPNNKILRRIQREEVNFLKCCIIGKEVWIWKYLGHCAISHPTDRGFIMCLLTRIANLIFTKQQLLSLMRHISTQYANTKTEYYNNVMTNTDFITEEEIKHPIRIPFGPITIMVAPDVEKFLKRSYPRLHRYNIEEQKQVGNHCPYKLSFIEHDIDI